MKKFIKFISILCFTVTAMTFGGVAYYQGNISDSYYIAEGTELNIDSFGVSCVQSINSKEAGINGSISVGGTKTKVSLFGIIPIKTVNVLNASDNEVVVFGAPFGIKAFTNGVLVVGFNDVVTESGWVKPAKNSGLEIGDTILSVNGQRVRNNSDIQDAVSNCEGKILEFVVCRGDKQITLKVNPVYDMNDKKYKTGLWVRDSSAGIGTLTFYSPKNNIVAGLGHGICDADTNELIPCDHGQFVEADIIGVKKASHEVTGELQGIFSGGVIARIVKNDITGIYGVGCDNVDAFGVYDIAFKQEITTGKAQILTTIDGGEPKLYECKIEKIYRKDSGRIKNMVIEVTDRELLDKTGGIVQGMSGSPIIQNGKLIGAVTHVLVDDPTKGYGIFAENMLETAQNVSSTELKAVS